MAENKLPVKVQVPGVSSKKDMPALLSAIEEELKAFDIYFGRVAGSALMNFEKANIRSYIVWKVLKDDARPSEISNT